MKQRQTLARVDDESRRSLVSKARDIIYRKNYAVDTDAVEKILKSQSLVPTLVSWVHCQQIATETFLSLECIYGEARSAWF